MGWKRWEQWKCIFAEQWEELYWEFFRFLSLIWSQPIYSAYVVFFAPGLLKMVAFFCPLIISTCLFVLVIFSLGPQLDRIRVERDLQWEGFKEAVGFLSEKDDGDRYRRFRVLGGVKRPWRCSTDWLKCLHDDTPQSVLYTGGQLPKDIEEEWLEAETENQEGGIAMAENESLGSSHSVILSKLGVIMERLVADLGDRVEFDALNTLEAIAQIFFEITLRQYDKEVISSSNLGFTAAEKKKSDDGRIEKTEYIEECSLVGKSGSVKAECVDRPEQRIAPAESILHREDIDASKALNSELDRVICDLGTVQDLEFESTVVTPESSIVVSYPGNLSNKDNGSPNSDEAEGDPSGSRDEDGLPGLDKCVFRSCRSFPLDASEEGFLAMDKLWEAENTLGQFAVEKTPSVRKEKDWRRTLACKLYEEQQNSWKGTLAGKFYEDQTEGFSRFHGQFSSSSGRIPPHQNYADFLVEKFTNGSSESHGLTPAQSPLNAEEMDLLWEEYNDAPNREQGSPIKGLAKGLAKLRSLRGNMDSDGEDGPESPQLCCLRAFRFSTGKMPLRKPNLVKISKAFRNFGLIQHILGPKHHTT